MGQEIVNYSEEWAKQAAIYAEQHQVRSGSLISTRGGVLSLGEDELPGNQACVIILDSIFENTYYTGKFDAGNVVPPVCYAFGRNPADMAPHESMQASPYFEPQSEDCTSCPHAVWGSADKGRGKRCQNRVRLALIPGGFYTPKPRSRDFDLELFTDPKDLLTADMAFLKVPVTSVKIWAKYVSQLVSAHQRPPHGVVTRIYLEPHANDQYHLGFELVEEVPELLFVAIMARHEEATRSVIQGYMPPEDKPTAPAGSLKGLRR